MKLYEPYSFREAKPIIDYNIDVVFENAKTKMEVYHLFKKCLGLGDLIVQSVQSIAFGNANVLHFRVGVMPNTSDTPEGNLRADLNRIINNLIINGKLASHVELDEDTILPC